MARYRTTVGESPDAKTRAAPPVPTLRVLYTPTGGTEDPKSQKLTPGKTTIGREADQASTVALDDPKVSRVHAILFVSKSGQVTVQDEQSRNGVWIGAERVTEQRLAEGEVFRIGGSYLMIRHEPSDPRDAELDGMLGHAPSIRHLRHEIAQVAPSDLTVLVRGESGTGKEVAARAIHRLSGRRGPFVPLNCTTINEPLAESQLFGHLAGAFTGARESQPGLFRAADGGTLLLDEIGDLSLHLQPKLLRVLEDHAVTPVGGVEPIACDVRIVAATNQDLEAQMIRGRFRSDLYARLMEFSLFLPPLRKRREDLMLLLRHGFGESMPPLEADLVEALMLHEWPHNIRELLSLARELRVRATSADSLSLRLVERRLSPIGPEAPKEKSGTPRSSTTSKKDSENTRARDPVPSREQFVKLLGESHGNVAAVARATGRSRMQIYRWVEQHGLDLSDFRPDD